jgi:hypothetical protein
MQPCRRTEPTGVWSLPIARLMVGPRPAWQAKDPNLRPTTKLVGLSRLELLTSRLSGVCSNHLSYRPGTPARPAPFGGGRGRSALNRT